MLRKQVAAIAQTGVLPSRERGAASIKQGELSWMSCVAWWNDSAATT